MPSTIASVDQVRSRPPSVTKVSFSPRMCRLAVSLRLPFLPLKSTRASAYVTFSEEPLPPPTVRTGNPVVIVSRSMRMLTLVFAGIVAGNAATEPSPGTM